MESIRAGLVFALKETVGAQEIRRRERAFARRALASWGSNPNLRILGNLDLERLAIFSFGVRHPRGMLHANFVVAVLSDLFGIQARSGCFCAGPYLHRMVPIDDAWSAQMHAQARRGRHGATLAFARVSFNYFISEAVFGYILDAVQLLANEGWKLLPRYRFDPATGLWHHATGPARPLLEPPRSRLRAGASRRRPRACSRISSTRRDGSSARRRPRRRPTRRSHPRSSGSAGSRCRATRTRQSARGMCRPGA